MPYPVSVCIIARDEAVNLPAALASVQPYVAEIIVLDTGSVDNTVEIARKYGAKVFTEAWQDDFSHARNQAIAHAGQPYILMLDADERLVPESESAIQSYLSQCASRPVAGCIEIRNPIDGKTAIHRLPRIFPNQAAFRFQNRIHEQLMQDGREPETIETGICITHIGYQPEEYQRKGKFDRNLQLLLDELAHHPHQPSLQYQIGRTYFAGKHYENAITYLQMALDGLVAQTTTELAPYFPDLLVSLAYCTIHLKKWDELEYLVSAGIGILPEYTDLYFAYGSGLIEEMNPQKIDQIPLVFEKCLALGDVQDPRYSTTQGVGSFLAHYNLGVFYESTGHLEPARQHYSEALKRHYAPAGKRLAELEKVQAHFGQ